MNTIKRALPKQPMMTFAITPTEVRKEIFDPHNPRCPFHKYIGNEPSVRIAIRIASKAFDARVDIGKAMGQWPTEVWACQREYPVRILLTGPRSVGKTTFARHFAELIGTDYETGKFLLPFAEVDGTNITNREQVLERIQQALREAGVPMVAERTVGAVNYYNLPPLVLFIDEIHSVPGRVMEGLLKMAAPNDGLFEVGSNIRVDCKRITIITGTTEPGKLKETLKSRFPVKLALQKHTLEELSKIIQDATGWDHANAMRLARLKTIPREALEIAKLVGVTKDAENCSVEKAISIIATDLALQDGCLTQKAIDVLLALSDAQPNGLSQENICATCENMDAKEFKHEIIPQLLRNEFHQALITVSSRHKITEAGLGELRKLNLIDY